MDKGIDYSLGQSNVNHETGIHYGVIHLSDLHEWAIEGFEEDYGQPHCPICGAEIVEYHHEAHGEYQGHVCDYACESCEQIFDSAECYPEQPYAWTLDRDGYQASMGEDHDIFVLKSPYYTYAQFCSPCAPGACYLVNALDASEDNPRAYCFGVDWFEHDKAPYPMYRVDTDELIYAPEES